MTAIDAPLQESDQAQTFFPESLEEAVGLTLRVAPEDFVPHPGTMLVKQDPPQKQMGRIILPDKAQKDRRTGVVVKVTPPLRADQELRDFYAPGDGVLFREPAPAAKVAFQGHGTYVLLQYCGEISDEILGKFDRPKESS